MLTVPSTTRPTSKDDSPLTPENYAFLRDYIHRESGIALGDDKLYLLQSRLRPIVEEEHLGSLNRLCDQLRQTPEKLRRRVVEALATHETLFFRDPAVFEALRTEILPDLAKQRQATRTLRIWSAACSTGQEAYSLGMLLLENGYADWNIRIEGTDLSSQIVQRATAGRFLQIEISRGLPAKLLVKYFQRAGLDWQIRDEIRRLASFTTFDLRQNTVGRGPFDLVLCRNVLIYFDNDTRKKILSGMRSTIIPGGYLLLGASETTFNMDAGFLRRAIGSTVAYQVPSITVQK
jgi:chemotaxis protein methyltransferase CheR